MSDGTTQQSGRLIRRSFIARHRVAFATAIAGVAALIAIVAETAPREAVPPVPAVAPAASAQFEYFPDLYRNQAKQIEEPVATF